MNTLASPSIRALMRDATPSSSSRLAASHPTVSSSRPITRPRRPGCVPCGEGMIAAMRRLRLAEMMSVLSVAADAGMGMPLESAQRTAVLAVRLGELAGLDGDGLRDAYYVGLLRHVGCVADPHVAAAFFGGDEKAARAWMGPVDWGRPSALLGALVKHLARDEPLPRRAAIVLQSLSMMPAMSDLTRAQCEVGSMLARDCCLSERVVRAMGQVFERWDGKGFPHNLRGDEVAMPVRVALLAHDVEMFLRAGGVEAALAMARERRGGAFEPRLVDVFARHAGALAAALEVPSIWEAAMAAEPGPHEVLEGDRLNAALRSMASFADLSCRFTRGHSSGVAALAERAGRHRGLADEECHRLRVAGLLHDLGRAGVSASIWEKPGALTDGERERVRLHAYFTERILARPPALAEVAAVASLAHERLDGLGYHRRLPASAIGAAARVLAAADVFHALIEQRPHRPAFTPARAAAIVEGEVRAGRLDGDAVAAVLAAAGERVPPRRASTPGGLSEREVEVLALVAVGMTNKEVAARLGISDRTVGHHMQHVYGKLGVTTRAAASLLALQYELVATDARPHRG